MKQTNCSVPRVHDSTLVKYFFFLLFYLLLLLFLVHVHDVMKPSKVPLVDEDDLLYPWVKAIA